MNFRNQREKDHKVRMGPKILPKNILFQNSQNKTVGLKVLKTTGN